MTTIAYLGTFDGMCQPSEVALGFFYVPTRGYFARVWLDNYGPFETREEAIDEVYRILYPYPPVLDFQTCARNAAIGWGAVLAFFLLILTVCHHG